jgi:hypothetical protein
VVKQKLLLWIKPDPTIVRITGTTLATRQLILLWMDAEYLAQPLHSDASGLNTWHENAVIICFADCSKFINTVLLQPKICTLRTVRDWKA